MTDDFGASLLGATADAAGVDVCICSFRRPEIVATLRALSQQIGVGPFRVVVADNTPAGEMRDIVVHAANEFQLRVTYVHAPANNISIARNACLDAARAPWIAFLDDDELPTPNWLSALLQEVQRGNWDAVLGPVKAVYPEHAPTWASRGDFHSSAPVWVRGRIRTAYTGNVLFRRQLVEEAGLRFRIELGKSGGEDEDFFYRFSDAGGRIGFAPDAIVHEPVPAERANMHWLLRRSFRAGQSHGSRLTTENKPSVNILIASGKAAYCGVGAMFFVAYPVRRNRYLTRAALHVGVVARLSGFREMAVY